MTTPSALDLAIDDLEAAANSARMFGYPQWQIDQIELLRRATVRVRRQILETQEAFSLHGPADDGERALKYRDPDPPAGKKGN